MTMEPWVFVVLPAVLPILLLAILVLFRRPEWAPSGILLVATVSPWSFSTGLTPVLVLTAVAASSRLMDHVVRGSRQLLQAASTRHAAVAFAVAAAVSALWGWLAMEPEVAAYWTPNFFLVQLGQLAALVLLPAALLLASVSLTTRRLLGTAVWTFLALTTAGLIVSLMTSAVEINLRGLVLTWSATLIYGQLLFNDMLDRRVKVILAAVLALTLYVKLVSGFSWVSGWLPTIVAMAVVTALRSKRAMLGFAAVAVVTMFLALGFLQHDYDREYEESGSTRIAKWTLIAQQRFVRDHFVIGTGPANYAIYFSAYTPQNRLSTHNNYADIFLQMGIVGIGLILWVLLSAGRLGLKLSRSRIRDPFLNGFVHSTVGGIGAVLVAMMLGDWFTPFVYNQTLAGFSWTVQSWVFIGALCAVPTILRREATRLPLVRP